MPHPFSIREGADADLEDCAALAGLAERETLATRPRSSRTAGSASRR
jgi:hypothetical protein